MCKSGPVRLWESATEGEGSDKAFLKRWSYDDEQRQVIQQALAQVIESESLGVVRAQNSCPEIALVFYQKAIAVLSLQTRPIH